jgi:hypothetical protein
MKNSDKVTEVNELHSKAMEIAQSAFVARIQSNTIQVKQLSLKAYEYEREAAMRLLNDYDIEPTRSVLFRSAASLALNFEDYREAEKMIALGLLGNPPPEILEELRELFISNIPASPAKPILLTQPHRPSPVFSPVAVNDSIVGGIDSSFFVQGSPETNEKSLEIERIDVYSLKGMDTINFF